MANGSLLEVLELAAQRGVVEPELEQAARGEVDALVRVLEARFSSLGVKLGRPDRTRLARLMAEDYSALLKALQRVWPERPRDTAGILTVGPSGSGKTELINRMMNRPRRTNLTTVEIDRSWLELSGAVTAIRDTPGTTEHLELGKEVWAAMRHYEPRVLIVAVANGYLRTLGTAPLQRRGQRPFTGPNRLEKYLTAALAEEVAWVETFAEMVEPPKHRQPYVVLVVNKMDLWAADLDRVAEVIDWYKTGPMSVALRRLAQKVKAREMPRLVAVSSDEEEFLDGKVKPLDRFTPEARAQSVTLLKAFLAQLLSAP